RRADPVACQRQQRRVAEKSRYADRLSGASVDPDLRPAAAMGRHWLPAHGQKHSALQRHQKCRAALTQRIRVARHAGELHRQHRHWPGRAEVVRKVTSEGYFPRCNLQRLLTEGLPERRRRSAKPTGNDRDGFFHIRRLCVASQAQAQAAAGLSLAQTHGEQHVGGAAAGRIARRCR
nr:hypothetical protein [Tanacetum cinerariifolium]